MADWLSSMQRTYEYYVVDPGTWKDVKKLDNIKSCSITRDAETETLGSATIDSTDFLGECYVRVYLITNQNGVTEKHPLGTFLVQTPSSSFDGKIRDISMDAYTPLIELKENQPPLGYSLLENEDIMQRAYMLCREHLRAPVVKTSSNEKLKKDFVANTDDTWMSFISDLIANAKYKLELDELGRVLFAPIQDAISLQPVWTYDDGDKSILYHDISIDRDLYGIPNVVEVVYSSGREVYNARIVNDDPNSPTSTVSRGREIVYREVNPSAMGVIAGQSMLEDYANRLLRELSSIECTISYSHGYCPVRLGDCVRINYSRAGLTDIRAKVISQTIKCDAACQVDEKAVFTTKLWGSDPRWNYQTI